VHAHSLGRVVKLKKERKPILEEIEELHLQIEDLKKELKALWALVEWGGSYITELLEAVGLQ